MSAVFPIDNPDAAEALAAPATSDKILVYDASEQKWKISTVAELQAVSGWTA